MAKADKIFRISDGKCALPNLEKDGEGIICGPLSEAKKEYAAMLEANFENILGDSDGLFILISEGVKAGKIEIQNAFSSDTAHTTNVIILEKEASLEIAYHIEVSKDSQVNDKRYVAAGKGASLRIEEIYPEKSTVNIENYTSQAEGSRSETVTVSLGTDKTTAKFRTDLKGPFAESVHSGLFVVSEEQRSDFDIKVNHLVPDCHSDVLIKGVATGNSVGSFTGMVYVAQDAQRTQAYQQSRNLLLSDSAQILTSPQLEIYADDVKCSHGATVGQQDGEAIYYMRQRGLSEEQARALQMTGFINDVVGRISDEESRAEILAKAENKLRQLS